MASSARAAPASSYAVDAIAARLRAAGCVFAEDEARLLVSAARGEDDLAAMVERRVGGEPVEHVLGWAEFRGLRIAVAAGVFVPRRRTELLVEQAVAVASPGSVVVELCCGSGAVSAALVEAAGPLELYAVDIEPAAVRCARRNIGAAGVVLEGDLFAPLPGTLRGRVDILVANAPYVPARAMGQMPPEARLHEPRRALDGGADGLDVLRRVAEGAPSWLAPGGHLLVETSLRQAPSLGEELARHGLKPDVVVDEELDATAIVGRMVEGVGGP